MPPNPLIIHWNRPTWFRAALHVEHVQYYCTFTDNERAQFGGTVHLRMLLGTLERERVLDLQAEFDFLTFHCERLMNTLKTLEGCELCAVSNSFYITNKSYEMKTNSLHFE